MTRQPLSARSEIAIEPTPPAAPVTSAAPADGVEIMALDRHQRQHGSEARGADRHRLRPGQSGRQLDQPVAVHPRPLGIAAEMGLAEAIAGQHDLVAGRKVRPARALDDSGEIDAEHHRKAADNRRLAAERQPVLVIDGRMGDADRHVAVHELGLVHVDELDDLPGVGLVGSNGAKGHGLPLSWRVERRSLWGGFRAGQMARPEDG